MLEHPLVECVNDRQREFGVVGGGVLDEAGERRVVQYLDHTLTVEFGHAGYGVARCGRRVDTRALHLAQRQPFGVLACEELLMGARSSDAFECRVRNEVVDPVVYDDPSLAAELRELDSARVLLRQILRQRVGCLVHVLVGVEDRRLGELSRHGDPLSREQTQSAPDLRRVGDFYVCSRRSTRAH